MVESVNPGGSAPYMVAAPSVRFSHLGTTAAKDGFAGVAFADGHAKSQKYGDLNKPWNQPPWKK